MLIFIIALIIFKKAVLDLRLLIASCMYQKYWWYRIDKKLNLKITFVFSIGERLVNVMGGTIIETASEKLINQGINLGIDQGINLGIDQGINLGMIRGQAKMFVELNQEAGVSDAEILKQMKEKLSLSGEEAAAFLKQYGKSSQK